MKESKVNELIGDLEHVWLYSDYTEASMSGDNMAADIRVPRHLAEAIVLIGKLRESDELSSRLWVLLFVEYHVDKWSLWETEWEIRDHPTLPREVEEDRKRYERFLSIAKQQGDQCTVDVFKEVIARRFKHFNPEEELNKLAIRFYPILDRLKNDGRQ
jgi:hypothetical protein